MLGFLTAGLLISCVARTESQKIVTSKAIQVKTLQPAISRHMIGVCPREAKWGNPGRTPLRDWNDNLWIRAAPFFGDAYDAVRANRPRVALQQYELGLRVFPTAIEQILKSGAVAYQLGDRRLSIHYWQRALELSHRAEISESNYCDGTDRLLKGQDTDAFRSFYKSLYPGGVVVPGATVPSVDDATLLEIHDGLLAATRGNYKQAVAKLREAEMRAPNYQPVHFLLGDILFASRDDMGAISAWIKVLSLDGYRSDVAHGPDDIQLSATRLLVGAVGWRL